MFVLLEVKEMKRCLIFVKILIFVIVLLIICCFILLNLYLIEWIRFKVGVVDNWVKLILWLLVLEKYYGGLCWIIECLYVVLGKIVVNFLGKFNFILFY